MRFFVPLLAVLAFGSGCTTLMAEDDVTFSRNVRPILAANCFACHGPDEGSREAELRLDTREGALRKREGRQPVVPGKLQQSELWRRITTSDADLKMPPGDSGHELSAEQINVLKQWIESGAEYSVHWSFQAPKRVQFSGDEMPDWCRNPIDRLVLARMKKAGLEPEREADRYTLIRRLSLDLTGLPPTIEDVDRFLNDESPQAYEALVDRLLESNRFGEHWARMWLDLARYADTKGYEKDQPRNIWRYRDWVIDAFNKDLPYDRFTIEQLAGDLLPNPTSEQLLATAFHRNTMTNDEGGTDNEEFRVAAVKDRVDTTVQVWMGLTMGCAKCHSHKYDPISQGEYYSFFDFFNQTEDADRSDDAPRAATPTAGQSTRLAEIEAALTKLRTEYSADRPELVAARSVWERETVARNPWSVMHFESAVSEGGARLSQLSDGSILASGQTPEKDVYTLTTWDPRQQITALRIECLTDPSLEKNGPGRNSADPNFVISELSLSAVWADGSMEPIKLTDARADFSQKGWAVGGAIDGKPATGWAVSPQFGRPHVAVFDLAKPLAHQRNMKLIVKLSQQYGKQLVLGRVRISVSGDDPQTLTADVSPTFTLAAIPEDERTAEEQKRLDDAFRKQHPLTAELHRQIMTLEAERSRLQKQIVQTPIMKQLPGDRRRTTNIHVRGNFLQKGKAVTGGVPAAFGKLPAGASADRLGVAKWIVHPDNPLTARVAVNRFWAGLFGIGLVETEEDFGSQGTSVSHPELLDWLAIEFRGRLGWSMKKLCRTIVLSSTYRQSSSVDKSKVEIDPRNRLLSRASRFRLSAESVRDQALAASGLLSAKVGGPPVMPPQPPGIWKATYSKLKWQTSKGEDRFRRGLYTFWRRTSPYPSMLTFDAGSREVCVVRRVRTNTPLQALVTLNDTVFVEAAGALARRAVSVPNRDNDRLEHVFRRCLVRPPKKLEASLLNELFESSRMGFKADKAATSELLAAAGVQTTDRDDAAELAAWTVVGNVLLNLDEVLMRN